ncbi:hypothetical protein IMPERIA75_150009 [Imperialibacter sp. 75]|nr:hypothetical protein IMPERIA75_150009 [Imperialibacter sp. 75]
MSDPMKSSDVRLDKRKIAGKNENNSGRHLQYSPYNPA